jgi:hypothetical protein
VLFIILMGLCLFAKAQLYAGVGGYPYGEAISTDLTLELRIRGALMTNSFSPGLRAESASADKAFYTSICVTGDYYFSRHGNFLRVFAGGGLGGFNESKENGGNNKPNDLFGFFTRTGVETGRFRLSGKYDFTGGINNYAAVNLGFFFGGGGEK